MNQENALKRARENGILIAAHRGVAGGNIPCNTIAAFEAALRQGADILETDLAPSGDGDLLIFHPKKEKAHLGVDVHLNEMTMDEIRQLRYTNVDRDPTQFGILTLDEFLETFKNRCLINLDHAWDHIPQVVQTVRRHGMMEQILMKSPDKPEFAKAMEELAPEMMYMPIFKEKDTMTELLETMNVNYVGAEVVFKHEDSCLISEEYIRSHHEKGRLIWVNPIIYYYKSQLSGGHSDDVAVASDPEYGWGWLMDKKIDILQTDWVMPLWYYRNQRKA